MTEQLGIQNLLRKGFLTNLKSRTIIKLKRINISLKAWLNGDSLSLLGTSIYNVKEAKKLNFVKEFLSKR